MTTKGKAAAGLAVALTLILSALFAEAASEVVYPSFYWGEPWNAKYLNELKAAFEKRYPDIRVNAINVPISTFWDKQYADVTAGVAPEIVTLFDPEIRQYIAADLLEPLDPWLQKAGFAMKDFLPSATVATDKGKTYGVIFHVDPRALYYNERLFTEANIPAPTDVTSFYAALKKLRDPNKQQFGFATYSKPGAPNSMYIEIMPLISGFGGKFFRAGKPTVTSPPVVAALEFYKKIYDEDLIPRGLDVATYRQMFISGKIAMYAAGPFFAGAVAGANPEMFAHLRAMDLPFPGKQSFTLSNYLCIPKRATNKDGAAKLLMMMLEDPFQKRILDIIKALPARKGMVEAQFVRENQWFLAFDRAFGADSYAPEGVEEFAPEILKIIAQHVENMLFKDVDAKKVAADMQTELEQFLAAKRK